jgi:hypothetical protein
MGLLGASPATPVLTIEHYPPSLRDHNPVNEGHVGHSGRALSNTGIVGSNPIRGMDVCVRLFCLCCSTCR